MASKSGQQEPEKGEVIEELLDNLDTSLDRVKVLYEQYFLGIQKQPPTYLHTDIERKIRDIAQLQIRNTALRYRFATLQQKFGSYNAYWRRTLRQIENGTYVRNLSKIGRQAARTGADVPEEIFAAMPKRMREQVKRDREAALAIARRREDPVEDADLLTLADEDVDIDVDDLDAAAFIGESTDMRRNVLTQTGSHRIEESDAEFDLDAFFAGVISEGELSAPGLQPPAEPTPPVAARQSESVVTWRTPGQRTEPRAPAVSRTRTDHPRPATLSGTSLAIAPDPALTGRRDPAARLATGQPDVERPGAGPADTGRPGAGAPVELPSGRPAKPPIPVSHALPRPSDLRKPLAPVKPVSPAPSQATRPVPVTPGASASRGPAPVETLAGPFPRLPSLPPLPTNPRTAPAGPPDAAESFDTDEVTDLLASNDGRAGAQRVPIGRAPTPVPTERAAPGRAASSAGVPSGEDRGAERVPIGRAPTPTPGRMPVGRAPTPVPGEGLPGAERVPIGRVPTPVATERAAPERGPGGRPAPAPPPRPAVARPAQPQAASPRIPAVEPRGGDSRPAPPPGMSDADVNALYAKYVKAKQTLGEDAGPGAYGKLLKTINAQAPKIMEQYKSRGVEFSVVVKDNQVIIRAKPKP